MASITVELRFTFCCQTVCWLLFFGSISSDIGRLDVTPTIVTASFTCKVVSQNITVVHSNHVLQCTIAVGPVAGVCTAFAFPTHLHFDTGGKEGSWWQWHHWLPYRQRHCIAHDSVLKKSQWRVRQAILIWPLSCPQAQFFSCSGQVHCHQKWHTCDN